jgi:hypothetical protein
MVKNSVTVETDKCDHFGTETNWFPRIPNMNDNNKGLSFNIHHAWKSNLGLVNLDKFDPWTCKVL